MLVSMLVRFFLLRFTPSIPCPGEFRALGLERVESDERFSEKKKIIIIIQIKRFYLNAVQLIM